MSNPSNQRQSVTAISYKVLKVTSKVFKNDGMIPQKYTCDGANVNPPLQIEHIPPGAKCLALIVDDPDAPIGTWSHWLAWNIPVTHQIKENKVYGTEGLNDFQQHRYKGPCPPSGNHRYFFRVYALDNLLNLPANSTKMQLEKALGGHIMAFGELTGLYKRTK